MNDECTCHLCFEIRNFIALICLDAYRNSRMLIQQERRCFFCLLVTTWTTKTCPSCNHHEQGTAKISLGTIQSRVPLETLIQVYFAFLSWYIIVLLDTHWSLKKCVERLRAIVSLYASFHWLNKINTTANLWMRYNLLAEYPFQLNCWQTMAK